MPKCFEGDDVMGSEPFIGLDGGRWFVLQDIDHCDAEGNWGMSTAYLASPWGYEHKSDAEKALAGLESAT